VLADIGARVPLTQTATVPAVSSSEQEFAAGDAAYLGSGYQSWQTRCSAPVPVDVVRGIDGTVERSHGRRREPLYLEHLEVVVHERLRSIMSVW